jgi:hypothetical protein
METNRPRIVFFVGILLIGAFVAGCGKAVSTTDAPETELGATIGSLTEVFAAESIPVEGYGLVGGLRGTGSAECPPGVRAYLKQYILTQLSERKTDVEKLISSRNTAVVRIHSIMPAAAKERERFDVRVDALPTTQTTSLEGGWLYDAELKRAGTVGIATRVLATAKGPVFIDTVDASGTDKKVGYILAGGQTRDKYRITLALRQPDYLAARHISDLLNARFGTGTANASPDLIELNVPAEYGEQKEKFISIIKAIYIIEAPQVTEQRIEALVKKLAVSEDKDAAETALEAIGNKSLRKLAALLESTDEQVRLRAARCMLNLGGSRGLETLREIAADKSSTYRIEALEAITAGASRNYAASISRRLLLDDDFDIRLAAYKQLRRLDDVAITRRLIADNFYLEQITRAKQTEIFVSRSGQPRIVLFRAPIYCRENIFVQSADGEITINAPVGQKYVSLIRKVPNRPDIPPIRLKSSFRLSDIIRTLCEEPLLQKGSLLRPGLNVSYADAIGLLKQMCEQGAVEAQFRAGPPPKID